MKIWFNHWFSQAYHFINMLKKEGYYVIGTNERNTCVYKENVDEFYIEPIIKDKQEYVNWCLTFCKEHQIDIFFVRRNMDYIVENLHLFKENNIIVICEQDIEKYNMCHDKILTANFFKEHNICKVPEMIIVNTVEEFKKAYDLLIKKYDSVCIKYRVDEGGLSFKEITNKKPSINSMKSYQGRKYDYQYIIDCLSTVERFDDLIVMPVLEGTEVSVDCLGVDDDLIAIPRFKLNNRVTQLQSNQELIDIAKHFYSLCKMDGVFNIQFRYSKGELYLLEINTRLAGGSWKSSELGCEFPVLAVEKFTNKITALPKLDTYDIKISDLENYVILH